MKLKRIEKRLEIEGKINPAKCQVICEDEVVELDTKEEIDAYLASKKPKVKTTSDLPTPTDDLKGYVYTVEETGIWPFKSQNVDYICIGKKWEKFTPEKEQIKD